MTGIDLYDRVHPFSNLRCCAVPDPLETNDVLVVLTRCRMSQPAGVLEWECPPNAPCASLALELGGWPASRAVRLLYVLGGFDVDEIAGFGFGRQADIETLLAQSRLAVRAHATEGRAP